MKINIGMSSTEETENHLLKLYEDIHGGMTYI